MFELATDCYACGSENAIIILILGIVGIAIGIYLIDKLKKNPPENKE